MRISLLEPFGWSQPRAPPGFGGGHGEERLHQLGIERGAQADGLRKTGAADGGMAVQALFVKNHRNPEPAVFQKELLNGVSKLRHGACGTPFSGIAGTSGVAGASD